MRRITMVLALATCAWAQLRIETHHLTARASKRLVEAQRRLGMARRSSWRPAKSEAERGVVDAVISLYRSRFQPPIGSEARIVTLVEGGNDILAARWAGSDRSQFQELIVWDTPWATSFIFRLPDHRWANDAAIQRTFENLLVPAHPPAPLPDVVLTLARDPHTGLRIGAGGLNIPSIPRQFETGNGNWLDLWETATASYLSVTFRCQHTPGFPTGMKEIAERFPPLEVRAQQWTKPHLIREIGSGSPSLFPGNRAYVLARELAKRDLTEAELASVRPGSARNALLGVLVETRQVARYSRPIQKWLLEETRWTGKGPVDLFMGVNRTQEADFTAAALEVLRREPRVEGAFRYAASHGSTEADYRALLSLPNPWKNRNREDQLEQMRRRLGLP